MRREKHPEISNDLVFVLSAHQRTTGMAVSMGWTCRCGFYADNEGDRYAHQIAMVLQAARELETKAETS